MDIMSYLFLSNALLRNRREATTINNTSNDFPYEIEVVAQNLKVPWAIAISVDGKLYVTERLGVIRVIENGQLQPEPLITLEAPFVSQGEGGLMGIALDPNFSQNGYMFIMYTYQENNQLYNRVVRLVKENNKAVIDRILIDRIPGGRIHNGGRIKIGPDKKLYITTGDAGDPALAQDLNSLAGKILRIELDGSIPQDNPFENSPIYSLGHRNPQGLDWNPQGILYASEHGQIGYDEINIIQPGANYGWPLVEGDEDYNRIAIQKPIIHSGDETWAPSGVTYINQGPWKGKLLVANLRGQQLLTLSFNENKTIVKEVERWLQSEYGRLREVIQAKDGTIYLATSNKDGRGNPDLRDDKIIKLMSF